jgi:hypothetical protein
MAESRFVTINVDAPSSGAGLGLRGEYFSNPDLTGEPFAVRNDQLIDFDWAEVAPIEGLSREGFLCAGQVRSCRDVGRARTDCRSDRSGSFVRER